jgi:hypothetical protein
MKKRRGSLSLNTIGVAIIVLIVIVIVIFVFRGQITNLTQGYTDISNKQIDAAKGEACESLFANRRCATEQPGDGWVVVSAPSNGWSNCGSDDLTESTSTSKQCYEQS